MDLDLEGACRLSLPRRPSQHLTQVLRLRAGDTLVLFNGDGRDFPARLLEPGRGASLVEVGPPGEPEPEPRLALYLGIGISKGERMEYALQKAVELGVSGITPIFTARGVVRLAGERLDKRQRHWQGVVIGACEQSGRRRLPELAPATALETWLSQAHRNPLLLDHRAQTPLPDLPAPGDALTLLVGPEGGLTPVERTSANRAGFTSVRMGPRIMRTETAPLAALAAVQALWGDFRV